MCSNNLSAVFSIAWRSSSSCKNSRKVLKKLLESSSEINLVMEWDGIVTKFHNRYANTLGITTNSSACIQPQILTKLTGVFLLTTGEESRTARSCGWACSVSLQRRRVAKSLLDWTMLLEEKHVKQSTFQ